MSLTPGQILSHYRIVGKVGEGGMGVVYKAEDTQLRRHVALKVLPEHLLADAERRRRFFREARAAAAVTHANITTIHQIDEADGIVFIAMELVEGQSLRHVISGQPMPMKQALRYAIEMAEGLAEAHKAHIIHRDLKPDNVILTTAGHVKLLDFGLAKLLQDPDEEKAANLSRLSTVSTEMTLEGRILGTPAYMSPEQIRGQAVDARSDLFSFGVMLYEMVTGRPPFKAATVVEVMAAVLGTDPAPPAQLNEAVPTELERIIRKCLQKDRDVRYQDTRDLLVDLRQLQEQEGSMSAHGVDVAGRANSQRAAGRPGRARLAAWIATALGVAGIALAVYGWRTAGNETSRTSDPFESMSMSSITGGSDIRSVALSPDARHLAIIREAAPVGQAGRNWSIAMRQLATGSEVQVLTPQERQIFRVTFSRDGEHIFYVAAEPNQAYEALFEIPALGGEGRKILANLDSAVGFSPDGRSLAFIRQAPQRGESTLVTYDLGSGTDGILARVKTPEQFAAVRPVWSPDGSRLLASVFSPEGGGRSRIVSLDAADGNAVPIGAAWADRNIESFVWLGGDAIALSARDATRGLINQLWRLSWPDGRRRRITNDLNDYRDISVAADGSILTALRVSKTSNLWRVSIEGDPVPRQLTFGSAGSDVIDSFSPTADGGVAFTAGDEAGLALWTMRSDGTSRRKLSTGARFASPNVMPLEGRPAVAFNAIGADLVPHIWRIDLDGGNAVQLTTGSGEVLKAISPDGQRLLYFKTEFPNEVWSVSTDGGESRKIGDHALWEFNNALTARYSPDGALIQFPRMAGSEGKEYLEHVVVPALGGEPIASFRRPPNTELTRWHPDGKSLTYKSQEGGLSTIMRWPIAGGDATPLFSFRQGRMDGMLWAPNGRALVFRTRDSRGANLWVWFPGRTSPPRPLSNITAGEIFDFTWSLDSRSVYFTQGISNRDVVLFRGLR